MDVNPALSSLHLSSAKTPSNPSLREVRSALAARFDVMEKEFSIAGETFRLLKVRDTNTLVDAIDPAEFADDERLPYWADIWTSSLELARACLVEFGLRERRILELGCGLGLAGIAAAKAGAHVTLSDYEDDALAFAAYNAGINLPEEIFANRVDVLRLDWRAVPSLEKFDMILAADVVYERRNFFPLVDVITKLLKPNGCAVFTEPGRSIGELFLSLLREEGFQVATSKHKVEFEGRVSEVIRSLIRNPD